MTHTPFASRDYDLDPISPRVRALDRLIEQSLADLAHPRGRRTNPNEALLFAGNWHDALPRLLIQDPVLEPVDKIIWAVIKTCIDPQRGTAFPNYATLARLANVSAEGTVTRALAILRVTRWLTLCGRARDGGGRFRGNVYVLHDEPLSLADTLHLDAAHMAFMQRCMSHAHARVSLVATGVMRSLELDIAEQRSPEIAADPVIARIEAQQLIRQQDPDRISTEAAATDSGDQQSGNRRHLFSRSFATRFELLRPPTPREVDALPPPRDDSEVPKMLGTLVARFLEKAGAPHQPQNLKLDEPQNLSPQILRSCSSGSCSSKEVTTTTEDVVAAPQILSSRAEVSRASTPEDPAVALSAYRWPDWLRANTRHLALLELRAAPQASRQSLLDLLDQRRQDGEAGAAKRLQYPVQYLRSLCRLAASGKIALREDSPETEDPSLLAATCPDHAELSQKLRIAEGDYRHWQRLAGLSADPQRKADWQTHVDRARAQIDACRSALAALDRAATPPIDA